MADDVLGPARSSGLCDIRTSPLRQGAHPDAPVDPIVDATHITNHAGPSAVASKEEPAALQAVATEPLAVSADTPLDRAAQLMSEHGVSHLVVTDAASGYPVGVLSTIDIAAVYAS
jgi:predicted transcriptional regulator